MEGRFLSRKSRNGTIASKGDWGSGSHTDAQEWMLSRKAKDIITQLHPRPSVWQTGHLPSADFNRKT